MRAWLTLALAVLACAALAVPVATAARKFPDYTKLIVKDGKKSVQAKLGDHCIPTPSKIDCQGGSNYPLTTSPDITLRPNGTVELLFGAKAGYVAWRAARVDGHGDEVIAASGEAKVVTRTKKRWRIVLPKNLSRSIKVLGLSVQYANGFSSFEVGARVG